MTLFLCLCKKKTYQAPEDSIPKYEGAEHGVGKDYQDGHNPNHGLRARTKRRSRVFFNPQTWVQTRTVYNQARKEAESHRQHVPLQTHHSCTYN